MTAPSWGVSVALARLGKANKAAEKVRPEHYHIMLVCNYKLSYPRASPAAIRREISARTHSRRQIRISHVEGRQPSIRERPRALETGWTRAEIAANPVDRATEIRARNVADTRLRLV